MRLGKTAFISSKVDQQFHLSYRLSNFLRPQSKHAGTGRLSSPALYSAQVLGLLLCFCKAGQACPHLWCRAAETSIGCLRLMLEETGAVSGCLWMLPAAWETTFGSSITAGSKPHLPLPSIPPSHVSWPPLLRNAQVSGMPGIPQSHLLLSFSPPSLVKSLFV